MQSKQIKIHISPMKFNQAFDKRAKWNDYYVDTSVPIKSGES